jgi:hypothetical protein
MAIKQAWSTKNQKTGQYAGEARRKKLSMKPEKAIFMAENIDQAPYRHPSQPDASPVGTIVR